MAYDKVIDSSKLNSAMTATADAIRGKTGGTAQIPWNESTGFASAVGEIETGGSSTAYDELVENLIRSNSFSVVSSKRMSMAKNAFERTDVEKADLNVDRIDRGCFNYSSLTTLVLRYSGVVELKSSNAFISCPMRGGSWETGDAPEGYLYVPDNRVSSYASDTNWGVFCSDVEGEAPTLILPLSDYEG